MSLHEISDVVKQKISKSLFSNGVPSLISQSWSLSWPMILMMFFEYFMNLTDVYVAGKYGAPVKAATGLSSQVYSFFVMGGQALTVGTVSVVSRLYSGDDKVLFKSSVFTTVASACMAGVLLSTLGILFAPHIVSLLKAPQEVRDYTISLLRIYSFGMFFHMVLINMNAVLRSCKLVKVTMKIMILASVLNIIFNVIFLYVMPIGYKGIAISTVISIFVAFLICTRFIYKMIGQVYKFSLSILKNMLSIGWPGSIVMLSWQIGGTALFTILALLPNNSVEIMAAYTTGLRIESAIFMPAFAFNMANAVIVGNLIGAKKYNEAFKSGIVTSLISVVIVTFMILVIILNAKGIARLLDNNEIVINETMKYLYICMISEPFIALNLAMSGALNGAGDTKATMRYAIIAVWVVRIPFAYILGIYFGLGSTAIWWVLNSGFVVQSFLSTRRFLSRKWEKSKLVID